MSRDVFQYLHRNFRYGPPARLPPYHLSGPDATARRVPRIAIGQREEFRDRAGSKLNLHGGEGLRLGGRTVPARGASVPVPWVGLAPATTRRWRSLRGGFLSRVFPALFSLPGPTDGSRGDSSSTHFPASAFTGNIQVSEVGERKLPCCCHTRYFHDSFGAGAAVDYRWRLLKSTARVRLSRAEDCPKIQRFSYGGIGATHLHKLPRQPLSAQTALPLAL